MAEYKIQGDTLTAIAEAIRGKTGKTDTLTPAQMAAEVAGISVGEVVLDAASVAFGAEQIDPDVNYKIGYNWFAQVVEYVQTMAGTTKDMTPADIVYWLGRVMYIPQGWASDMLQLAGMALSGGASGYVVDVQRGSATSTLAIGEMNLNATATGALEE